MYKLQVTKQTIKQILTALIILILISIVLGQTKKAKDFGYTYLQFEYKSEKVDILIKSKKGEENIPKPLFFFCQGSLPKPLIKCNDQGAYGIFPFNPDSLTAKYHLAIVRKSGIPLIMNTKELNLSFV